MSAPWTWQGPLALALSLLSFGAYAFWAIRRLGIGRRPLLVACSVLAVAPALYVGLLWSGFTVDHLVRFDRPLWAFPCALVLLFVCARLTALPGRSSRVRRASIEALTFLCAFSAVLALLGCELGKPINRLAVLIAIDKSRSIDLVPNAAARVRAELQLAELGMKEDDRIGTIAFASEAELEDPLRPRTLLPSAQSAEIGRDGTDLGEGIRRALGELPPDSAGKIVIISDGVATRGDALDAASAAAVAGVPIDVVPLDQSHLTDIRVIGVRTTSRANQGEPLDLRIATASTAPAEVELRVYRDGELIRRGETGISAGEDVVHLREIAPDSGLHRYEVQLTAKNPKLDQAAEDNTGSTFVRVRGPSLALVLDREPELAAPLVNALSTSAFRVQSAGIAGVPADIASLAAYDVVALSAIAASELSPTQLQALASYVRDLGGGLLLMGGDRAMGPGGYGKTPIEEVSPVSFDLKQERRRASLAEIIVIDYSGSMGARVGTKTKLDLANEAAARSAELLGAGDRLGVMHVDTTVRWTVPLAAISDPAAVAKAIKGVDVGGGGIYVDLALRNAYDALAREKVNLKHVLLFADGNDAEERQNAFALVSGAKRAGVTTSVIALGRGSDVAALEHMSKLGDGRFYLLEDASRLPSVFAQETILAARSAINEVPFRPELGVPGAALRGVDFAKAPALTGYVVTIAKPRAQVHLHAAEGDPLLATWSVGIGRSAAFTSDFRDRWGAAWTSWAGATQLFGQLARDIARRGDDARVRLEADAAGGELHVRATVVSDDGRAETFRRLKARVAGPDGFTQDLSLDAVGAGAYAARAPLIRPGAYIVTAVDELSNEPLATTGAVLTPGEELRPTGSDRRLLAQIAALTGGRVRDTLAGLFLDRASSRFAYRSVSDALILLSAASLLLAVAARRLAIPESLLGMPARLAATRARRIELRRRAQSEQHAQSAHSAEVLGSLLEAKGRAFAARAPSPAAQDRPAPPGMPRVAAPSPVHPPAHASTQRADEPPAPEQHKQSAAEILLARRRGRRS